MAMSPRERASGAEAPSFVAVFGTAKAVPCRVARSRLRVAALGAALGKDSTSVGPFLWRNVSFMWAIAGSLPRQTVISAPCSRSCSRTRARNASSGGRATRTVRWRFRIIFKRMCDSVNFFRLRFPWLVGARLGLTVQSVAATLRLSAIILLIGTDNLLYEVMAYDVLLGEL